MKKRFTRRILFAALLAAALAASARAALERVETYPAGHFTDVAETDWFEDSVKTTYEYGVMNGKAATLFAPADTLSVAEALTLSARIHALTNEKPLSSETSGVWYEPYIRYLKENGFLREGRFDDYDRPIRRYEFAEILSAVCGRLPEINTLDAIPDVSSDLPYESAVLSLYRAGILTGNDETGTFGANTNLLRSEIAAMLSRVILADKRVAKTYPSVNAQLSAAYALIDCINGNGRKGLSNGWTYDNRFDLMNTTGAQKNFLHDESDTAFYALARRFEVQKDGKLTLEAMLDVASSDGGVYLLFEDENENAVVGLRENGGYWELFGENATLSAVAVPKDKRTPVVFRMTLDLDRKTAFCTVDEKNVGTVTLPEKALARLVIGITDKGKGTVKLNHLKLDKNYLLDEHFFVSESSVGKAPMGWDVTGDFTVEKIETEFGADVFSLRGSKATAEKKLDKTSGRLVLKTMLLLPKESDSAAFSVRSAGKDAVKIEYKNGKLACGGTDLGTYTPNVWQTLAVKADTQNKTADIYINGKKKATVACDAANFDGLLLSTDGSAVWFDDVRVSGNPEKPADYPAKPQAASSDNYEVGMNMCYLWRDSESLEGWDAVSPFAEFEPYLGYYDDGLTETADWELKQMAEHGVDFINVCWYAPQEKMTAPIKKMRYSHAALNEGYMNAENSDYVKFCIMWENSTRYVGASNLEEFKEYIWKYWKEYYFSDSRYETLDGKALLTVWSLDIFLKTFGGTEGAAQAVAFMRSELMQMGYDGLVLLFATTQIVPQSTYAAISSIGADGTYNYHWSAAGYNPSVQITGNQTNLNAARSVSSHSVPTVSIGFNDIGRNNSRDPIISVADHLTVCEEIKKLLADSKTDSWRDRTVMISTWNEYSEGTYIAPTASTGFDYLENLRTAFTSDTSDHASLDAKPTNGQKSRVSHLYPEGFAPLRRYQFEKTDAEKIAEDTESLVSVLRFDMANEKESAAWDAMFGIDGFARENGVISGSSTRADYAVYTSFADMPETADMPILHIRMKTSEKANAEIFFVTSSDGTWNNVKKMNVALGEPNEFHDYYVNMSALASYKDKLTALRLDPCTMPASFEIALIEFMQYPVKLTPTVTVNTRTLSLPFDPVKAGDDYAIVGEADAGFYSLLRVYYEWNRADGVLTLKTADKKTLVFTVGKDTVNAGGKDVPLGAAFTLRDGLPVFRIKELCELLGYTCEISPAEIKITAASEKELAYLASLKPNEWNFDSYGDDEGWLPQKSTLEVSDGKLYGTPMDSDPAVKRSVNFDASEYTHLLLGIRYSDALADQRAQLFFITETDGTYNAKKCINVRYDADGKAHKDGDMVELVFDLHSSAAFKGKITGLRLDPFSLNVPFEIDYIKCVYDETLPTTPPEESEDSSLAEDIKPTKPVEAELKGGAVPAGVDIATNGDALITLDMDPDTGNKVWRVKSTSSGETFTYFDASMQFEKGKTYEITYTIYPTEDSAGNPYRQAIIGGSLRYGDGGGTVANHTFGGNSNKASGKWFTETAEMKIDDSYVPSVQDCIRLWGKPVNGNGIGYLVAEISVKIKE